MDGELTPQPPAYAGEGSSNVGDAPCAGERKTRLAVVLTLSAMVVEIAAGLAFGSMALLADGLHMAAHAAALGIAAFAYSYARARARDRSFVFGVGKVNALGGYTSAVLLVAFAAAMGWESVERLVQPTPINYDMALGVAVFGLIVNVVSARILHHGREPGAGHDHNLRAAYVHVLADALTSVLAIAALSAGRLWGAAWLDPIMGLVGAAVVTVWAAGLLRETSGVLLDKSAPSETRRRLAEVIEQDADSRVVDLKVWRIGPRDLAVEAVIEAGGAQTADVYRARIPSDLPVTRATFEIRRAPERRPAFAAE